MSKKSGSMSVQAQSQQRKPPSVNTQKPRPRTGPRLSRRQRRDRRVYVDQQKQLTHGRVASVMESQGSLLARQMAIPDSATNIVRVPTQDMPRTSAVKLISTEVITTGVYTAAQNPALDMAQSGDLVLIVYGLPGLAFMYGPVVSTLALEATTQTYTYTDHDVASTVCPITRSTMQPGSTVTSAWLPTRCIGVAGANTLASSQNRTFAWFDPGEKFFFSFMEGASIPTVLPVAWSINIYRWEGPGDVHDTIKTLTYKKGDASSCAWDVSTSGWYSFDFTVSAVDSDTITALLGVQVLPRARVVNPALMRQVHHTALMTNETAESVRRTGFSVLVTNTTSSLAKQGTVIATRLVNDSTNTLNPSWKKLTMGAAEKYTGAAANGVYTYMDFDASCEVFQQAMHSGASGATSPCINLEFYGYLHSILITNPDPTNSANNYLVTYTGIYEFRTDSMLYLKSTPQLDFNALVEARRVNNSTEYFYENPLHLADIWGHIKKAFNTMRKGALPLGIAASAMFPESAGIVMPVARALQT